MRLLRRNSPEFFIGDIPGSPGVSGHRPHLGVGPEGDGHEPLASNVGSGQRRVRASSRIRRMPVQAFSMNSMRWTSEMSGLRRTLRNFQLGDDQAVVGPQRQVSAPWPCDARNTAWSDESPAACALPADVQVLLGLIVWIVCSRAPHEL